jgi:hypothetical protein
MKTSRASHPPEFQLGALSVRMGFITQVQLEDAIAYQERRERPEFLGSILLMLDYLTPRTLAQVLAAQKRLIAQLSCVSVRRLSGTGANRFGRIAVEMGLCTEGQIEEAARAQSRNAAKPFLGSILMDLGYLKPDDVPRILARQFTVETPPPAAPSPLQPPAAGKSAPPPKPSLPPPPAAVPRPATPPRSEASPKPAAPPQQSARSERPGPAPARQAAQSPAPVKARPPGGASRSPEAAALSTNDLRVGAIAVRMGLVTQPQLNAAVSIQGQRTPRPFIGGLLVELGLLSNKDLGRILAEQADLLTKSSRIKRLPTRRSEELRFGGIAMKCGFITQAQLDEALGIQGRSAPKPFLGAVLVDLGYLSFTQIQRVLSIQDSGREADTR